MDLLFEIIFEFIFEGLYQTAKNKKAPFLLRITAASFLMLFFLAIVVLLIVVGIIALKRNVPVGIVLFVIDAFIVALIIKKLLEYLKKKER